MENRTENVFTEKRNAARPRCGKSRPLSLGVRLETALAMTEALPEGACVADIGCDHGRLLAEMLERRPDRYGIAADISLPSLEKARALAARRGLEGRVSFRAGNGLSVLRAGEADAVIVAGMGGELIASILSAAEPPLMGARLAVLQPMRGAEELHRFLYENGYLPVGDRIVLDAGRYYELISVRPPQGNGTVTEWPDDFPEGFFSVGRTVTRDECFYGWVRHRLSQAERRLASARGKEGEQGLETLCSALKRLLSGGRE